MKTELKNRTIWFDGTSQVSPELVPDLLLEGFKPEQIVATSSNDDLTLFNTLSEEVIEFGKDKNRPFNMAYQIPQSYREINLSDYLGTMLNERGLGNNAQYIDRTRKELEEIRLRGMEMLVKTLIYVIDMLKETGTFWGVGRGSSCASLVLFLIGLHKVDPIKYNIPMTEFFHD